MKEKIIIKRRKIIVDKNKRNNSMKGINNRTATKNETTCPVCGKKIK
jgi:hypothetical protein